MIVAEPDEELPCELGHGLGHGGQAAPQYPVQVLIGVILCVQERVCRAILPGQGGKWGVGARAGCGQAQGLPLWDRARSLTSMKENSTAGTPAKAVKE